MKNSVLMTVSLALCACLAGCEDQQQEAQPIASIVATADSGNERPKFNGSDCVGRDGNCLPPVIVYPHRRSAVVNFDDIMSDASSVGKYFSGNEWQEIFLQLTAKENSDVLQALRSGKYHFIKHHSKESGKTFYIGGQDDVSLKNYSLVIPIIEE